MHCMLGLLMIIFNYNFNCLTKIQKGINTESVPILIGDTNHNGWDEIIFGHSAHDWFIYEYVPVNSYNEVFHPWSEDTMFEPRDVGDCDKDGQSDICGVLGIVRSPQWWVGAAIFESKTPHSYPDSLIWVEIDTTVSHTESCIQPKKITDLDSDGKMELFCAWRVSSLNDWGIVIYENQGNNSFKSVWKYYTGVFGTVVFGDFDSDGKQEFFKTSDYSTRDSFSIYECVGNDSYELTWIGYHPETINMYDAWLGNDTDQDGKPEIFMKNYWYGPNPAAVLTMWESTGDNSYELVEIDTIRGYDDPIEGRSTCGDVDGDSIDEVIVSVGTRVIIYKATGDNTYERVWEWENDFGEPPYGGYQAVVACHDFNKNGYEELVISGNDHTAVFEIDKTSIVETKPYRKPFSLLVVPSIIRNSAIIRFTIPEQGKVELVVYDALGRIVERLVDKELKAGVYTVRWAEKKLPAGIYFFRLKTCNTALTYKTILTK